MGLIVYVLKADGVEEMRTLVECMGEPVCPGLFEPTPECPAVLVDVGPVGALVAFDAVNARVQANQGPAIWEKRRESDMVGPMSNGRFVYCSDSRFPANDPLRYFDRFESQAFYNSMWS